MLGVFAEAGRGEVDEAEGADPDELEPGDDADEHDEVEQTSGAGVDGDGAPVGDREVRDRQQHRGHAPFKAAPGADGVEDEVAGQPRADDQGVAGGDEHAHGDGGEPDESKHDTVLPTWTATSRIEGLAQAAPWGRQPPVGLVAQAIFTAAVPQILPRPPAERKGTAYLTYIDRVATVVPHIL